jgi:hypothetical protein
MKKLLLISILIITGLICSVHYISFREQLVLSEQIKIIDKIDALSCEAIKEGRDWKHYYDNFDKTKHGFTYMVFVEFYKFHWDIDNEGNVI